MTDMARMRNRLQDRWINWQEERERNDERRQQQTDIRRSRMTCSARLPSYTQAQDWTGSAGVSPSGRFQVIEERRPKVPLISRDGIRWDAALAFLVALGVVLAAFLLADLAGIGTGSRILSKLDTKIAAVEDRNLELREELALSGGSVAVCTEAVKMDLISSNGARTIRITAPEETRMTLTSALQAAENADLEGRMKADLGD